MSPVPSRPIVLTGATGFVGRSLLPRLLEAGHRVRAVSRRPAHQLTLPSHPALEFVQADVSDPDAIGRALAGAKLAYYLVHSMEGGPESRGDFVDRDRRAAAIFARAASAQDVERIVYLGGLAPPRDGSRHLRSRLETEERLRSTGVPVSAFRAGFIIGAGSAGFLMLQSLVRKQHALVVPPELDSRCQPAYLDDVVEALARIADEGDQGERVWELGSEEIVTYRDIIEIFANCAGLTIRLIDVPWAPRRLAAAYIAGVTGLSFALVEALSEGWQCDLLVEDDALYRRFPDLPRTPPREAICRTVALQDSRAA